METNPLILISFLSALWVSFLFLIRGIQFAYPEWEDGNIMVNVAAESRTWRWPSQMHQPGRRSTYMKDMTMLLLVVFQKIFRDRKSAFPLIALQGSANIASAFLIFFIANAYWSLPVAWLVTILFIASFWPWQIAINVGHVAVATFFFLLAVYATILSTDTSRIAALAWIMLAGCFFSALVFSSASFVKYITLFFAAFIFARNRTALETGDWSAFFSVFTFEQHLLLNIIATLIVIGLVLAIKFSYLKIVALMYEDKLPKILKYILIKFKRDMAGKKEFALGHYQNYAKNKLNRYGSWLLRAYVILFVVINFIGFFHLVYFLVGLSSVFLVLTLPDIKKSISFYWLYVRENQVRQKTAFRDYAPYFVKMGIHVDRYFRSGKTWAPKAFFRMTPYVVIIFLFLFFYLIIVDLTTGQYLSALTVFFVAVVSLLPIIWGEITSSPTSARNYFPGFVGILAFLGYALNQVQQSFPNTFLIFALPLFACYVIWNFYNFITDILPSRLTVNKLIKTLDNLEIKEFYTYKTEYNSFLIDTFRPHIREKYEIKYISSLNEIKNCWVVVPPTNYKTVMFGSEEIFAGKNFTSDPTLNELIDTRRIEKVATAKFKTFGSSRFWIQDHEVISYHDLILNDITSDDRIRSYVWLINTDKLL